MRRFIGLLALGAVTLSVVPAAGAASDGPATQDPQAISAAAADAVEATGSGVHASAALPDPRLRLAACPRPLQAELPAGARGARFSVRVSCAGQAAWSVLVPVQVETEGPVVVARRALVPGTIPLADDLELVTRRIPGLAVCCATRLEDVLGQRVRRPLAADRPVPLDSLEAPPVVRRGEMVTVLAGSPGFEVRSSGVALADARIGDTLRIRHPVSLRVIQARADGRGVVRADR